MIGNRWPPTPTRSVADRGPSKKKHEDGSGSMGSERGYM